ncbi:MAG: flagellar hook-associated protein FlgK [Clostridia bacterium]|nr:flagellar hook-associated protein FlgK [Clostridia bacterium]
MPSQFFGLTIGYSGLVSAQAAINTTGNNISNVETKGYSRQQVIQKAADALRTYTSYGMAGSGVDTTAIEQIRNAYYDFKYWNNNANLGEYNIKQYYMKQIENYFQESEKVDGFTNIYDNFYTAMEELQKNAGDSTVRAQFLSFAGNLTEYFNEMNTDLVKLQEDTNAEIKNKVDEINSIAARLTTLNRQINVIEMTGSVANELRDQRALLIDDLSKIADVEVKEIPIYTTEGGTELSGANKYMVSIAGQELVNGYEYNTVECVARSHKINESDAEGLYELKWSNGLDFNLYGGNLGGELKGLMQVRDGNNEEYFHGTIASVTNDTITFENLPDYLLDLNKTRLPESGILNVGAKQFEYTGWSFDSTTGAYTFELDLAPGQTTAGITGKGGQIGKEIDYMGIPYYQSQLNEWVRSFAEAINEIELTGKDQYGNPAGVLFIGKNSQDHDHPFDFSDYTRGQTVTSSSQDTYYKLTAANITVSYDMIKDVGKLATTTNDKQGESAYDLLTEMKKVKTDKDKMTFRGCSSQEFLQCITADIALNANSANTFQSNYENISNSITHQRLSVSGVDNDEEAISLVKYQNAYNLSSKMIQVMTELYDQLILRTGA